MTRERSRFLHQCLHELVADFAAHSSDALPPVTLVELMGWSYQQTILPDENNNGVPLATTP